jgi:hypothetical protein
MAGLVLRSRQRGERAGLNKYGICTHSKLQDRECRIDDSFKQPWANGTEGFVQATVCECVHSGTRKTERIIMAGTRSDYAHKLLLSAVDWFRRLPFDRRSNCFRPKSRECRIEYRTVEPHGAPLIKTFPRLFRCR